MDNTSAKNIVYSFGTTNMMPYLSATNNTNTFTDIDVNANFDQLIDNDLFNYLHAKGTGSVKPGPDYYDPETVSTFPDGSKFWKESETTDSITILRKSNNDLSSSIARVSSTSSTFVTSIDNKVYVGGTDGLRVLTDNRLVKHLNYPDGQSALAEYHDDNGTFIVASSTAIFVLGKTDSGTSTWIRSDFIGKGVPQAILKVGSGADERIYVGTSSSSAGLAGVYRAIFSYSEPMTFTKVRGAEVNVHDIVELGADEQYLKENSLGNVVLATEDGVWRNGTSETMEDYKVLLSGVSANGQFQLNGSRYLYTSNGIYKFETNGFGSPVAFEGQNVVGAFPIDGKAFIQTDETGNNIYEWDGTESPELRDDINSALASFYIAIGSSTYSTKLVSVFKLKGRTIFATESTLFYNEDDNTPDGKWTWISYNPPGVAPTDFVDFASNEKILNASVLSRDNVIFLVTASRIIRIETVLSKSDASVIEPTVMQDGLEDNTLVDVATNSGTPVAIANGSTSTMIYQFDGTSWVVRSTIDGVVGESISYMEGGILVGNVVVGTSTGKLIYMPYGDWDSHHTIDLGSEYTILGSYTTIAGFNIVIAKSTGHITAFVAVDNGGTIDFEPFVVSQLDSVSDQIYKRSIIDLDGRILVVLPDGGVSEIWPYNKDSLTGMNYLDSTLPDIDIKNIVGDGNQFLVNTQKTIDKPGGLSMVYRIPPHDGDPETFLRSHVISGPDDTCYDSEFRTCFAYTDHCVVAMNGKIRTYSMYVDEDQLAGEPPVLDVDSKIVNDTTVNDLSSADIFHVSIEGVKDDLDPIVVRTNKGLFYNNYIEVQPEFEMNGKTFSAPDFYMGNYWLKFTSGSTSRDEEDTFLLFPDDAPPAGLTSDPDTTLTAYADSKSHLRIMTDMMDSPAFLSGVAGSGPLTFTGQVHIYDGATAVPVISTDTYWGVVATSGGLVRFVQHRKDLKKASSCISGSIMATDNYSSATADVCESMVAGTLSACYYLTDNKHVKKVLSSGGATELSNVGGSALTGIIGLCDASIRKETVAESKELLVAYSAKTIYVNGKSVKTISTTSKSIVSVGTFIVSETEKVLVILSRNTSGQDSIEFARISSDASSLITIGSMNGDFVEAGAMPRIVSSYERNCIWFNGGETIGLVNVSVSVENDGTSMTCTGKAYFDATFNSKIYPILTQFDEVPDYDSPAINTIGWVDKSSNFKIKALVVRPDYFVLITSDDGRGSSVCHGDGAIMSFAFSANSTSHPHLRAYPVTDINSLHDISSPLTVALTELAGSEYMSSNSRLVDMIRMVSVGGYDIHMMFEKSNGTGIEYSLIDMENVRIESGAIKYYSLTEMTFSPSSIDRAGVGVSIVPQKLIPAYAVPEYDGMAGDYLVATNRGLYERGIEYLTLLNYREHDIKAGTTTTSLKIGTISERKAICRAEEPGDIGGVFSLGYTDQPGTDFTNTEKIGEMTFGDMNKFVTVGNVQRFYAYINGSVVGSPVYVSVLGPDTLTNLNSAYNVKFDDTDDTKNPKQIFGSYGTYLITDKGMVSFSIGSKLYSFIHVEQAPTEKEIDDIPALHDRYDGGNPSYVSVCQTSRTLYVGVRDSTQSSFSVVTVKDNSASGSLVDAITVALIEPTYANPLYANSLYYAGSAGFLANSFIFVGDKLYYYNGNLKSYELVPDLDFDLTGGTAFHLYDICRYDGRNWILTSKGVYSYIDITNAETFIKTDLDKYDVYEILPISEKEALIPTADRNIAPVEYGLYRFKNTGCSRTSFFDETVEIVDMAEFQVDGIPTAFAAVRYSDGIWICTSTDYRKWTRFLPLPSDITGVTDMLRANADEYWFTTPDGTWKTSASFELIDDYSTFTESDAKKMFNMLKDEMEDYFGDILADHIRRKHASDSTTTRIVNEIEPSDFSDIRNWTLYDDTTIPDSTFISNDLVFDVEQYSTGDDDTPITLSSYNRSCCSEAVEHEITDASVMVKKFRSGMTEIYIDVPTTYTYYMSHLSADEAAGCCDHAHEMENKERPNLLHLERGSRMFDVNPGVEYTHIIMDVLSGLHLENILAVEVNGASLPRGIYKDKAVKCGRDGLASLLFHGRILPSFVGSVTNTDEGGFRITTQNYGTDEQCIKIVAIRDYSFDKENGSLFSYMIEYRPGVGGTGTMAPSSVSGNKTFVLPMCKFENPGHEFIGWTDGNGGILEDGRSVINLTTIPGATVVLTALWRYEYDFSPSKDTLLTFSATSGGTIQIDKGGRKSGSGSSMIGVE